MAHLLDFQAEGDVVVHRHVGPQGVGLEHQVQPALAGMSDAISVCVLLFILFCYIFANKVAGADIGKSW